MSKYQTKTYGHMIERINRVTHEHFVTENFKHI